MVKQFIPTSDRRKEERFRKKTKNIYQMELERDRMENNGKSRVNIKALDLTLKSAFDSWLGFKPQKAVMVDRVIISTNIPIPREDWLKVVDFLEDCIKRQEGKKI